MLKSKTYKCFFDGCCTPINFRQKIMGWGIYIFDELENKFTKSRYCDNYESSSCNVAEYLGLIMLLEVMKNKKNSIIEIYGDSKMVINQMNGTYKARKGHYIDFVPKASNLLQNLAKNDNKIILEWIPREFNTQADKQSKLFQTKEDINLLIINNL
jgi:ribonuclease HI